MITGELKSQIDRIWDAFWSGGISNPLEVIEQITYLLFLRRLDDLHTLEENKADPAQAADRAPHLPRGQGPEGGGPTTTCAGRASSTSRRPRCSPSSPSTSSRSCARSGGDGSTYAHHMKDARFTIPTPALLAKVVDLLDQVPMEDRDTKGDLYEYMLGKIATAGQNGQFRTPRHIIRLMVEMTAPQPEGHHLRSRLRHRRLPGRRRRVPARAPPGVPARRQAAGSTSTNDMFHGFDFDNTMLRIGSMNMLLHGVENPDIRYRDSLAQDHAGEEETLHPGAGQSAVRRLARLREHRQGPAADRQDQEDRAALPRPLPAPAEARRPRRGHRARRRAVRLEQRAQGRCAGCWSRTRSSTP